MNEFLPLLLRKSFFNDRDVLIKGNRDLVNRINAMRKVSKAATFNAYKKPASWIASYYLLKLLKQDESPARNMNTKLTLCSK